MYKGITIASLSIGVIMCALIVIVPKYVVGKPILEDKSKLKVLRIFAAFMAFMGAVAIVKILNNPYLFS